MILSDRENGPRDTGKPQNPNFGYLQRDLLAPTGASGPQSPYPRNVTAWLLLIDARFPWRQVKSGNVGFVGTRDVGEEEVCRFEAVRQRVGDRT
jgi:hypothetical protein